MIVGERLHHRPVELSGLVGPQKLPHREDMRERRLLQLAHCGMALIDRGRDARPVAMFGLDCSCEAHIVGPQFQLEGTALNFESLLQNA